MIKHFLRIFTERRLNVQISMFQGQKVLLTVAPSPPTTQPIAWNCSNLDQIGLTPVDNFNVWAQALINQGKATITVSCPGYQSEGLDIEYAPLGTLNLTAGTPI